jgi:hypothetical protein
METGSNAITLWLEIHEELNSPRITEVSGFVHHLKPQTEHHFGN